MNDVECSFSTELDGPFTALEGNIPEPCVLGDVVVEDMAVVASVGCDDVCGGVVVGSDVAVVVVVIVAAFVVVVVVVVVVGGGVVFTVSAGDSTPTQKNA